MVKHGTDFFRKRKALISEALGAYSGSARRLFRKREALIAITARRVLGHRMEFRKTRRATSILIQIDSDVLRAAGSSLFCSRQVLYARERLLGTEVDDQQMR